jgi:predicted transcriptional regulator
MTDIGDELKRVVRESGKNVKTISKESKVSYDRLAAFVSGRTHKLDARMAQRVFHTLTGKDLV